MDARRTGDLRGQNHSHGVVQHALSEEQRVQVHVYLQLVEDSQDRHCEQRQTHLVPQMLELTQIMTDTTEQGENRCGELYFNTLLGFYYTSTALICNRRFHFNLLSSKIILK